MFNEGVSVSTESGTGRCVGAEVEAGLADVAGDADPPPLVEVRLNGEGGAPYGPEGTEGGVPPDSRLAVADAGGSMGLGRSSGMANCS